MDTPVFKLKIFIFNFLFFFFDLTLFNKKDNDYLLKEKILNENLKDFREEYLSLSNFKGDSLNNCEAYVLEKDVNELLDNYIYLIDGNKRFFFKNHEELGIDFRI